MDTKSILKKRNINYFLVPGKKKNNYSGIIIPFFPGANKNKIRALLALYDIQYEKVNVRFFGHPHTEAVDDEGEKVFIKSDNLTDDAVEGLFIRL
jgi:hypothetical protein